MIKDPHFRAIPLRLILFAVLCNGTYTLCTPNKSRNLINRNQILSLHTTNTWHELNAPNTSFHGEKEKCAIRKIIRFNAKRPFKINSVSFYWSGEPLHRVDATLYSKKQNKPLVLIEHNMISDGKWSKDGRNLVFNLNEKLIATKEFFLVLNFPATQTVDLKAGRFHTCRSIKKHILPLG